MWNAKTHRDECWHCGSAHHDTAEHQLVEQGGMPDMTERTIQLTVEQAEHLERLQLLLGLDNFDGLVKEAIRNLALDLAMGDTASKFA